ALVLYFLGEFDKKNKTNFVNLWKKGNMPYTYEDYLFFKQFLGNMPFERLCITPHIFHEFYKHIQRILPKDRFYPFFQHNIDLLVQLSEEHVNKNDLMIHHFFDKLEIGEHSLYLLKKEEIPCVILTDDEREMPKIFQDDKDVLLILMKDAIRKMINS
ncbi:MAG: hypothetical protein KKF67_02105, partial [Nanoarchaeota archaeon]|nr:hypothetical protein [Nanoarchaeota archaeon]